MRIFLDTNVLVSALATRGLSADVLRVVLAEHQLLTSELVLEELQRVLADKIGAPAAIIDAAIVLLRRHHVQPQPEAPYALGIGDAADEWIVASAISSGAELFVTSDRKLLDATGKVAGLRVLSPRGLWNLLSGSSPRDQPNASRRPRPRL